MDKPAPKPESSNAQVDDATEIKSSDGKNKNSDNKNIEGDFSETQEHTTKGLVREGNATTEETKSLAKDIKDKIRDISFKISKSSFLEKEYSISNGNDVENNAVSTVGTELSKALSLDPSKKNNNCMTCKTTNNEFKMEIDPLVDLMSSALTDVVMHAETNMWNIVHISSETNNKRRNSKRSQTHVTRTLSLNLEIPNKKMSDVDRNYRKRTLQTNKENKGFSTLSYAIMHKYVNGSTLDVPCTSSIVILSTPRSSLPPTLVLNDCDISCVGDLDPVKSICHGVRELDLAQNKITDLTEVQKILNTMQRLTFLNLSSNDFSKCTSFPSETGITLDKMKWLVMNSTFIPGGPLDDMLRFMPNLEELYLSLNNYQRIGLQDDVIMPSVHVLHVSGNPLQDFQEVVRLGWKFPNLETLVMADCFISSLGDESNLGDAFQKLQSFNISNNDIDAWEEIDKLRLFPSLSDLRLLGQPLLEDYNEIERRQLVIGRLSNVERLNGSRVSEEERQDAERAFIRHYMQSEECLRPMRYNELVEKHGHLDPLVNIDLRPQTVVEVLLRYGDKTELRSLSVRQTVMAFKASLLEFTGLIPAQMRIFYVDKEVDKEMEQFMGPEELKYNSKMLYTYNVRDGDEFHIDKKK